MIRCIILDDEPWAIDLLKSYVEKIDYLELVFASESPVRVLNMLKTEVVDLIFLDIQMPEMDGIALMEIIDKNTSIIVTTAYSEYALKGYEHNIVDYILKPIEFARFVKAVERAKSVVETRKSDHLLNTQGFQRNFLFVKTDSRLVKVFYEEILYIEGLSDYIAICTKKEKLICLDSLGHMETLLPPGLFTRIHKSYIVCISKIDSIERNRVFIEDKILPIGLTYKAALMKLLGK